MNSRVRGREKMARRQAGQSANRQELNAYAALKAEESWLEHGWK